MPIFPNQKSKKIRKAENFRALAKELIENEEWSAEKSAINENQNKKQKMLWKGG